MFNSIKTKIIACVILGIIVSSVIIGIISVTSASNLAEKDAKNTLVSLAESNAKAVNADLSKITQSVDTFEVVALEKLDTKIFISSTNSQKVYTESIKKTIKSFAEKTDGCLSAYIRYNPEISEPQSGLFLIRKNVDEDFKYTAPTDFSMYDENDVEHVGWYYIPVKNGAAMWMDPYYSDVYDKEVMSYVIPLFTEDKTNIGIIGMDIQFSSLTDIVDLVSAFKTGYAFLYDNSGNIIHHKEYEPGTSVTEIGFKEGDIEKITNPENKGTLISLKKGLSGYKMSFYPLDNGMNLGVIVADSEIDEEAKALSVKIIFAVIICVCLCGGFGILMANGISSPITKVTDIVSKSSSLDFSSNTNESKLTGIKDETGVMAQAVSKMRDSLRDVVETITNVEGTVINNMANLQTVMDENNAISEDNSATTEELAASMEQTSASTAVISENITSVKNKAENIRRMTLQGKEESGFVMNRAVELKKTTGDALNVTQEMYEDMRRKSEVAIAQAGAVHKINELTESIKAISTQTNLLSLNANIEAARAGDAGKGFAVVATEIGGLAGQTFETVDAINQIVQEVNIAVSNITECLEVSMNFLENNVMKDYESFTKVSNNYEEDAKGYGNAMDNISRNIDELAMNIEEINDAVLNVSETVNQAAEGISLIANKSGEAVNKNIQGMDAVRKSQESIDTLREIISRFKI